MANYISRMLFVLFFLLTSFGVNNATQLLQSSTPPAVFIFGDSTSDVGTNNYISSIYTPKADKSFYGIDYEHHQATGRWSNGFNMVDHLCQLMGFKLSPPPFLASNPRHGDVTEVTTGGYNFASGGSGLFNSTAYEIESEPDLPLIPVLEQIDQFLKVRQYLIDHQGEDAAMDYLRNSIYIMSIGNNDIIRSTSYPAGIAAFWDDNLPPYMDAYSYSITVLYNAGARKFGFVSPLPIGCLPMTRAKIEPPPTTCSEIDLSCDYVPNLISQLFHSNLTWILTELQQKQLPDITFSIGNTPHLFMLIMKPKHSACACCGAGTLNAEDFCNPETPNYCNNRDEYTFWDGAHPTDASSKALAQELYTGGEQFMYPRNFRDMVARMSTDAWSM